MRRITSHDVLSAKIVSTALSVEVWKYKEKSEVNIRRFWVYILRIWGQKPLGGLTPNFLVVDDRDVKVFQIW